MNSKLLLVKYFIFLFLGLTHTKVYHSDIFFFLFTRISLENPLSWSLSFSQVLCLYRWHLTEELTMCKKIFISFAYEHFIKIVQLLSHVRLFAAPWTAARQASVSISSSWSLLKLMSIESVMPSNHLILCCPLFLPPSIFPNIRVFSNESVLRIRWPKY